MGFRIGASHRTSWCWRRHKSLERSQEALPAALGMEYLAAAGRGLPLQQPPSAAPMVFLVKDLPGSILCCPVVCGSRLPPTS